MKRVRTNAKDAFIDDSDSINEDAERGPANPLALIRPADTQTADNIYDDGFEQMMARTYDRARASDDRFHLDSYPFSAERLQMTLGPPGDDDCPVWRVACRNGFEEYIVAFLLDAAEPRHQLVSVTMRDLIRGSVYLECRMNSHLILLLNKTPGIIRNRDGIKFNRIDSADLLKVVSMKDVSRIVEIGKWVSIQRGLYKGDIGLVLAVETWGVEVLLVPRLIYGPPDKKQKRKATTLKPPPSLFEPKRVDEELLAKFVRHDENTYSLGSREFQHGLVAKTYNYLSIGREVSQMPWMQFMHFASSEHPNVLVSHPPRPSEWSFAENDEIMALSLEKKGILVAMDTCYVDVDMNAEGVHRFPWYDVQKEFALGDYVRITGGRHLGKQGWITETQEATASVFIDSPDHKIDDETFKNTAEIIEVHVNCACKTTPPYIFNGDGPGDLPIFRKRMQHPWVNTEVIITKFGHPRRGRSGKILSVLANKATSLVIQLSHYDPAAPFPMVTITSDNVVELHSHKPLLVYFKSKRENMTCTQQELPPTTTRLDCGGSATPMPSAWSSTPAWNPSSETPVTPESTPLQGSSTLVTTPLGPSHSLLHRSFVNLDLQVVADGGKYKKKLITVKIVEINGHLYMRHVIRGVSNVLEPEWIEPRHPSPTHFNGLVVVIEGEHHGKYLRRLFHDGFKAMALMIGVVVERREGHDDRLTGEQVKVAPKSLCIVEESQESFERMKGIMLDARHAYKASLC